MSALFSKVHNRGTPPESFINDLIAWGRIAPDSIFEVNQRTDIYDMIKPHLGPWKGIKHRKAAMLEVLRVLAGFESSWRWSEGKDITNPKENSPETESAGPFQISANSMNLDKSLKDYAVTALRNTNPQTFRRAMMTNRAFAIGYTARLLRINTNHNGPVKRGEILRWLSKDAVLEFERELS